MPDINSANQFVIIDDDQISLFLCKTVIQKALEVKSVTTFCNPLDAVLFFETSFIKDPVLTVVLIDINMPELSGWEVLDKLNKLEENVKDHLFILMLSSSIDPKDKQQAKINPLVAGYLEKPLTIHSFRQVLISMKSEILVSY